MVALIAFPFLYQLNEVRGRELMILSGNLITTYIQYQCHSQ